MRECENEYRSFDDNRVYPARLYGNQRVCDDLLGLSIYRGYRKIFSEMQVYSE